MSNRKTSQEEPTQPRPRDAQGRELDRWGLPLSGPARQRALAKAKKPDPNEDPGAWETDTAAPAKGNAGKTEKEQ